MRAWLFVTIAVSALAKTVPSFEDDDVYDLVLLAEEEAMATYPAHMRLRPAVYATADEARRAAEKELSSLGEELPLPHAVAAKAVKEAMSIASVTMKDPYHSDMEGLKVNLGHTGDYALEEEHHKQEAPKVAQKAVDLKPVDDQNEQRKEQSSLKDVPSAKRAKVEPTKTKVRKESLPRASLHLLDEERGGTRPQAFPYGMPFSFQPQMGAFPGMFQVPKLQSPDLKPEMRSPFMMPAFKDMFPSATNDNQMSLNDILSNAQPMVMPGMPSSDAPAGFSEIMTQIAQAATKSNENVGTTVPDFSSPDPKQLLQAMPQLFPQMMKAMPQMVDQMNRNLVGQMPQMMQSMPLMMDKVPSPSQLADQLPKMLQQIMPQQSKLTQRMNQLLQQMPQVIQQMPQMMSQQPPVQPMALGQMPQALSNPAHATKGQAGAGKQKQADVARPHVHAVGDGKSAKVSARSARRHAKRH